MSSTAIKATRTPLAEAYAEQKKRVAQQKTSASPRTPAQQHPLPNDVVTLSTKESGEHTAPDKLKPSQPVTFEEMQALRATFSVHA